MLLVLLTACSAGIVALMVRVGAMDHPVARSSHTTPTPKGGGVGIVAAVALGLALGAGRGHPASGADIVLAAAGTGLAVASYCDDVLQWPFWLKLTAQIAAAAAILGWGLFPSSVAVPSAGAVPLGLLAPILALAWLLFATNAVNFMDGLNGLAAGSVTAACLVLVAVRGLPEAWPEAVMVAAIAGFLPFNYPAARIFMGDVGSQFLGFMGAALALRHAADSGVSAILPLSLAPLLLDVAITLLRRTIAGARLTQAHRGHFYQLAHRAGMPAWCVTALYWGMAIWAGSCAAAMTAATMTPHRAALLLAVSVMPFAVWCVVVAARCRKVEFGTW